MSMQKKFDDTINFRCFNKAKVKFQKHCQNMNREPHDMIRELITALTEGRLTIKPTAKQKKQDNLYVD